MDTTNQQEKTGQRIADLVPTDVLATDRLLHELFHENRFSREAAAYALKPRHEKRVTDALIRASSLERDDHVLYAIVGALIGRDDEDVLFVIVPRIEDWDIPWEYFLYPRDILEDDFQKRKQWGRFDKKKVIAMVEGMAEEWWCYE